jgi:hypothetical protein
VIAFRSSRKKESEVETRKEKRAYTAPEGRSEEIKVGVFGNYGSATNPRTPRAGGFFRRRKGRH